jgi:outer membrane protein assembly factor BamB
MKIAAPGMRAVLALAALVLVAACANDKKKLEKPVELTKFTSTAKVERVWTASTGEGAPKLRLGLSVATDGKAIFAASYDGDIEAFSITNGKKLWQTDTKLKLTGGPGAGEGLVVAGANKGDIVALDAATGAQKWRIRINSEVLAAPVIGGGMVVMRLGDGRIVALNAADGKEVWSAEQSVPKLSLRGTSRQIITGDVVLCGFDSGRVMALALKDGETLWDVTIAPPSGKSDIERLNDMDSMVRVVDNDVYAVTYQGKAARVDRETGQLLWTRDVSSYSGVATDEDGVFVSGADGALVKIGRRTGIELWKQEVLARRRLSPPAVLGSLVAVADLDGYVHFLDSEKGELAGRIHALSARVNAVPLVVDDLLIMMDVEGKIVALRAAPLATKG